MLTSIRDTPFLDPKHSTTTTSATVFCTNYISPVLNSCVGNHPSISSAPTNNPCPVDHLPSHGLRLLYTLLQPLLTKFIYSRQPFRVLVGRSKLRAPNRTSSKLFPVRTICPMKRYLRSKLRSVRVLRRREGGLYKIKEKKRSRENVQKDRGLSHENRKLFP